MYLEFCCFPVDVINKSIGWLLQDQDHVPTYIIICSLQAYISQHYIERAKMTEFFNGLNSKQIRSLATATVEKTTLIFPVHVILAN